MNGPRSAVVTVALVVVWSAAGCDEGRGPSSGSDGVTTRSSVGSAVGTAIPLSRLFPLGAGDRWRLAATPGGAIRLEGVVAIFGTGIIGVGGTSLEAAKRYRMTEEELTRVTRTGEASSPILRAPLEAGAEWSYEHRERDVTVPCDVRVMDDDARETVAGLRVNGCVSLRRRCRYPAGAPFTNSTTHTSDETYCPDIGLARVRSVFRPAPGRSALASDREERVVGFRVIGGPTGGPREGCARFILLPSDLVTACGTDVRSALPSEGEDIDGGACRYVYQHGTATLTAVVGAPSGSAPPDTLAEETVGDRSAWLSGPSPACRRPSTLSPLLASLLR